MFEFEELQPVITELVLRLFQAPLLLHATALHHRRVFSLRACVPRIHAVSFIKRVFDDLLIG